MLCAGRERTDVNPPPSLLLLPFSFFPSLSTLRIGGPPRNPFPRAVQVFLNWDHFDHVWASAEFWNAFVG